MAEVGAVLPGVAPTEGDWSDEDAARPTIPLPLRQLFQISLYWLGINAIMGGINVAIVERVSVWFPADKGFYITLQGFLILAVNIIVQPTVGMISDYTKSRWGRRKPYIAIGATLDVVFIVGLATSNTYVVLVAFLALLQFSSNFAQGPFQGYVPDLVPEKQVGLASAMVGAMQTVGFIVGGIVVSVAYILPAGPDGHSDFTIPTIVLGLIEFATAMGTVLWVREGGAARERHGRSWFEIAKSAWATDILRERSFVFLVLSRLMFFAGMNALLGWFIVFFNQTLKLTPDDKALLVPLTQVVVALVTIVSTFPSARISDRVGRKPVIYVACLVGGLGLVVVSIAPAYPVFLLGAMLLGSASGTFLAVDWALMTDIIPKAASGRYMGISNIAVAAAGQVASILVGPLIDIVGQHRLELPEGPRVAEAAAVAFFVLAAVFLRRVDPRKREDRMAAEASVRAATVAPAEA
ncbi:MAG: MFS transporter [Chloroflexi bacterium]|nr:MFS transporter [Chloroflexota bacterium]